MDVHYHRGQGALGLMDLIRIYYNKFSWDKSMFHASHKNLRCTVEDIDQLNSRMPVGRKIGASVGVIVNEKKEQENKNQLKKNRGMKR